MDEELERLLEEQKTYYRERAPEYDQVYFREGPHDRGPEFNARWFRETKALEAAVEGFAPTGRVLELACGTGLWTRYLVRTADELTAVDAAPEVIELNRERVDDPRVRYEVVDLFSWEPEGRFDSIFFGFWLSHVPPDGFDDFWRRLATWLEPSGRVLFVDDRSPLAWEERHSSHADDDPVARRRLADGREFRIVKAFYAPEQLAGRLAEIDWRAETHGTGEFFLYGSAVPNGPRR